MTEKLRSHLKKNEKGFTLIELLVVIAIIAILVVIVIVAINPIQRLKDASDRAAASNVRSTGTLLAACVTSQLALTPPGTIEACGVNAAPLTNYGTVATGVRVWPSASAGDTDVCAVEQGSSSNFFVYRYLTAGSGATAAATAGTVTTIAGTAGGTNATECP